MREDVYRKVADKCRALADEFHNLPERPFVLNAADVYEGLADEQILEVQWVSYPITIAKWLPKRAWTLMAPRYRM